MKVIIFILVCFLTLPSQLFADNDVDLTERISLLEDQVELFQQTKTQDVLNAFDNSSFAHEMIMEMRDVRREVTSARVQIGKGAATLESLEKSLKENQEKVNINTDGINLLGGKIEKIDVRIPVIERRVDLLEIKNEKRNDSRSEAYLDILVLLTVGGISWLAAFFYKKYRAFKVTGRGCD